MTLFYLLYNIALNNKQLMKQYAWLLAYLFINPQNILYISLITNLPYSYSYFNYYDSSWCLTYVVEIKQNKRFFMLEKIH